MAGLVVMVAVDVVAVPGLGLAGAALGSAVAYVIAAVVVTQSWARGPRRSPRALSGSPPSRRLLDDRMVLVAHPRDLHGARRRSHCFHTSVASIYEHVDRITVITTHDRDWLGHHREPSALVTTILGHDLDPERKIDLIVSSETNEGVCPEPGDGLCVAEARLAPGAQSDASDAPYDPPDYFLIIDADEIYEAADFQQIVGYIAGIGDRCTESPACGTSNAGITGWTAMSGRSPLCGPTGGSNTSGAVEPASRAGWRRPARRTFRPQGAAPRLR